MLKGKIFGLITILIAMAAACLPTSAHAIVVIHIDQVNGDVVATATGSLSLTGLIDRGPCANCFVAGILPNPASLGLGSTTGPVELFDGDSPASFGLLHEFFSPDAVTGMAFSIGNNRLKVPVGFVNNSEVTASASWYKENFNKMGLVPGEYLFGSQRGGVAAIVYIGDQDVPEASTWAMMLLGFGVVGWATRRSRRRGNLSACINSKSQEDARVAPPAASLVS